MADYQHHMLLNVRILARFLQVLQCSSLLLDLARYYYIYCKAVQEDCPDSCTNLARLGKTVLMGALSCMQYITH